MINLCCLRKYPAFMYITLNIKQGVLFFFFFCGITELLTSLFLVKEMFLHFGKSESDPVVVRFLKCTPITFRVTIPPLPTQKTTRAQGLLSGLPSTSKSMSTAQMTWDNLDKTYYLGIQRNSSEASTHWFYALCIYIIKKKQAILFDTEKWKSWGFPGGSVCKESVCNAEDCLQYRRPGFDLWVGKFPRKKKWQLTPVFLPGKFHECSSLAGHSPWGHKELDTTE